MKKIPILILGMSFFAYGIKQYYNAVNYMFNVTLGRGNKMFFARCNDTSREEQVIKADMDLHKPSLEKWETEVRQTGCYIKSLDNQPLYAKIFLQNSFTDSWAIVVHGYGGTGNMMYYAAKEFYEKGYNVVVPDLRGHGKSGGSYISMGWYDRLDLIQIINAIVKGNNKAQIALYGVSMGAATVLMTGGEALPDNVEAIVADCSYDNIKNIFSYQIKKVFRLPSFPFINTMSKICKRRLGFSFKQASVEKQLENCNIPVLFFHGEKDRLVPTNMVYKLYSATKGYKELYVVKNAGHGVSSMVEHNKYWGRVFDFLAKQG